MMKRYTIRMLILMLGALAILPASAVAKVGPLRIRGWMTSIEGRYASRGKDSVTLVLDSVTMISTQGNPLITRRIYMAAGETTDPSRFTAVRSFEQRLAGQFEYGGRVFEWDLSREGGLIGLDTLLRDLPAGIYSFYATADDGEGESAPANFITIELPPSPSSVLSTPVIEEATSPAIGLVVLSIAPMQFSGAGIPNLWFNVYRADGSTLDRSEFEVIELGPKPWDLLDTLPGRIGDVRQIVIGRLKSGDASFYVGVKTEPGPGKEMLVSNIVTVRVEGSRAIDDPVIRLSHITPPSAVPTIDRASEAPGAAYPNPATDIVWLPIPNSSGDAFIRIVDARGEVVLEGRSSGHGTHVAVDIASLPPGPYWASIVRGEGSLLRGIVIAR